jgi:hypothetical protein
VPLSNLNYALWIGGTALEALVCILAIYRRLYLRLPVFTAYLALVFIREAASWWVYFHSGQFSGAYFIFYWATQALQLAARGMVTAELCWVVLRPYSGVWRVARLALVSASGALVLYSALQASERMARLRTFFVSAERGLEFAVMGTLIVLFAICRYYGIRPDRLVVSVAMGLSLYSCFAILNNSILGEWLSGWFRAYDFFRRVSFHAALLVWIQALVRPLARPDAGPALDGAEHYLQLAPEVTEKMREMNNRLLDLLKGAGLR